MENQASVQKPKKANLWLIAGGVVLVALLIGAAFVAGRLLKKPAVANEGMMVMGEGGRGMAVQGGVGSSEELPDRAPDVTGMMQKVENNSIFVEASSGPAGIMIRKEGDQVDMSIQGEGDTTTVEIVVTRETQLYKKVAALQMGSKTAPEIVPATLDEVKGKAVVTAWGERKGDRLIAEVVLCTVLPKLDE